MNWKPQASEKSPGIDAFLTKIFGTDRVADVASKTCVICRAIVSLDSFRDELSLKEFHISAFCQDCQDKVYGK